jgi:hypothetical protein
VPQEVYDHLSKVGIAVTKPRMKPIEVVLTTHCDLAECLVALSTSRAEPDNHLACEFEYFFHQRDLAILFDNALLIYADRVDP